MSRTLGTTRIFEEQKYGRPRHNGYDEAGGRQLSKVGNYGPLNAGHRIKRRTHRRLPPLTMKKAHSNEEIDQVADSNAVVRKSYNVRIKERRASEPENAAEFAASSNFRTQQTELEKKFSELTRSHEESMRRHQSEIYELRVFLRSLRGEFPSDKEKGRDSERRRNKKSADGLISQNAIREGRSSGMLADLQDKSTFTKDSTKQARKDRGVSLPRLGAVSKTGKENDFPNHNRTSSLQHASLPYLDAGLPRLTSKAGSNLKSSDGDQCTHGKKKGKRFLARTVSKGGLCKRCLVRGRLLTQHLNLSTMTLPQLILN